MKNKDFKIIEKRLYNYYCLDKNIESINKELNIIDEHITKLEEELKNSSYLHLDIDIQSPAISERVQTSNYSESSVERRIIILTDKIEHEILKNKEKKVKLINELYRMKIYKEEMSFLLLQLDEQEKVIINEYYKNKRNTDLIVSQKINKSQTPTRITRIKALEKLDKAYNRQHNIETND